MKDEGDVEGFFCGRRRLLAGELQQKISGMRKLRIGIHHLLPFSDSIVNGNDHRDLRCECVCLAHVRIVIDRFLIGIVERQRGNRGAQNLHRRGALREAPHHLDDARIDLARLRQPLPEVLQFLSFRKCSEPQQVADFFKVGVLGEFVDVDATISKNAFVTIDIADSRISGDDSFKTFCGGRCRH